MVGRTASAAVYIKMPKAKLWKAYSQKVVFVWCSLNRVGKHQSLDFINCFVQLDLGCNFGIAMASQKHFHHAILVFFMLNDCQLSPWRCKRYTLQEVGFLYVY
jgi:hypothetical protein